MSPKKKDAWRGRMDAWFYDNREHQPAYMRHVRLLARKKDRHFKKSDPVRWAFEKSRNERMEAIWMQIAARQFDQVRAEIENRGPLH